MLPARKGKNRMRRGEFGAEVRHHDGTGIIDLYGEIDLAADGPLGAAYDEAVRGDPKGVVLNFAHVDYIDRDRPDRRAARTGPQGGAGGRCLRAQ